MIPKCSHNVFETLKKKLFFDEKNFFQKFFESQKKKNLNSQNLRKSTKNCHSRQLRVVLERQIIIFGTCKCSYRVQEVKLDLKLATCVMKRNTLS